jgi:hypothetical protein
MRVRLLCATVCLSGTLVSCVAALSDVDTSSLRNAQENDLDIYRKTPVPEGGGSPIRAEARGAYCGVDKVLRDLDAAVFDSDGDIVCVKPK